MLNNAKGLHAHRIDDLVPSRGIWPRSPSGANQDTPSARKARRLNLADSGNTAVAESFHPGCTLGLRLAALS